MYTKFYSNTILTKYIKGLISNTPLPLIDTVRDGDYIIKGVKYIYKFDVILCTESGYISELKDKHLIKEYYINKPNPYKEVVIDGVTQYIPWENEDWDNYIQSEENNIKFAKYQRESSFRFNEDLPEITERFYSNFQYYDSLTHRMLGKYLRCIRDLYNVNLMPFYNCFSYDVLANISLSEESTNGIENRTNDKYKLLAVPIKFNRTYTIYLDCPTKVLYKSVIYGKMGLVNKLNSDETLTDELNENLNIKLSTNFLQPFTYRINNTGRNAKLLQSFEDCLYLLIQVPTNNTSSFVVLEGDYTSQSTSVMDIDYSKHLMPCELDRIYLSKLSLTSLNNKQIYAFSNRLIEYLLGNVITNMDTIDNNVKRVEEYLQEQTRLGNENTPGKHNITKNHYGMWNNELRKKLFEFYENKDILKAYDITGYVDKDIEKELTRGLRV